MSKKSMLIVGSVILVAVMFFFQPLFRDSADREVVLKTHTPPLLENNADDQVMSSTRSENDSSNIILTEPTLPETECITSSPGYFESTGELVDCRPMYHSPKGEHPYASYADETLELMSYSDSEAAFVLGKRLAWIDRHRSMMFLIRSSALNKGNYEPFLWMLVNTYAQSEHNGTVILDNYKSKYMLLGASRKLGGEGPMTQADREGLLIYFKNVLMAHDVTEEELFDLENQSLQVLAQMQQVEYEIEGTSILKGKILEYNKRGDN